MPNCKARFALRAAFAASGAALIAAPASAPAAPAPPPPPPILFQDLSAVSGGPVDFGEPKSTVEKSACCFFDADGDGWDDLVSLAGLNEPHRFFLNRDDGAGGRKWVAAPAGSGLDTGACFERDGAAITAGDVDNDGDEDLFIGTSWNADFPEGSGQNILLLNDGTGRFTDAAEQAGLLDGDNTTTGCVLFDLENDGDLDLLTCNTDFEEAYKSGDGVTHLWRNELKETGTLHFTDEAALRGIFEYGVAVWCATATDFDGDGDQDVLIGHDITGTTQLFRNVEGTGIFEDISTIAGAGEGDDWNPSSFGDDSYNAMGAAWGDIDNDGDLDLYLSNIAFNPLYRNNGNATLTEIGRRASVRGAMVTWGVNFADFDLDGFCDLYVGGGDIWTRKRAEIRSFLYRNRGDSTFTDVLATANMRHDVPLHREGGTACADFDHDGRVDLLVARSQREGASPYLYHNITQTTGRRWLTVTMRGNGVTSNVSAIGARLRVIPKGEGGKPIAGLAQLREVSGGDSRSSRSSLSQTVGLGTKAVLADLVVTWPRAGTLAERTQTYTDVPLDRGVTLTEDLREPVWRLTPAHEVVVPDRARTELLCLGDPEDGADPLATLAVESGPAWAAVGPWRDGRTLLVNPPRVDAEQTQVVALLSNAQGATDPESRQTLTVRIAPAPRLSTAKRVGTTQLELTGDHIDLAGLEFTIDGKAVKRTKAWTKIKRPGGAVIRYARLAVPKAMRSAVQRKRPKHAVTVRDPVRGWSATLLF